MSTNGGFCVATTPTPLFNRQDFPILFGLEKLPFDEQGLLRCVEMVALPGSAFTILSNPADQVLEVITNEYPHGSFYIDARLVEKKDTRPPERQKSYPEARTILSHLQQQIGLPYIWGGNIAKGVQSHQTLYASHLPTSIQRQPARILQGLDCSGLLYEAFNGSVPRNTFSLFSYGEEIFFRKNVKPLDIIVWPGHVIIFLDSSTVIESIQGKGVIVSNADTRINEISDKSYKIRRCFFLNY